MYATLRYKGLSLETDGRKHLYLLYGPGCLAVASLDKERRALRYESLTSKVQSLCASEKKKAGTRVEKYFQIVNILIKELMRGKVDDPLCTLERESPANIHYVTRFPSIGETDEKRVIRKYVSNGVVELLSDATEGSSNLAPIERDTIDVQGNSNLAPIEGDTTEVEGDRASGRSGESRHGARMSFGSPKEPLSGLQPLINKSSHLSELLRNAVVDGKLREAELIATKHIQLLAELQMSLALRIKSE